ncbi:MAG: NAD(P)/FAD-dependent oxidoreductase [Pseudomonadota bacterium]
MTPNDSCWKVQTAIIGAGFGGIGMAIQLAQSGQRDFVLLEKADGVGGTWWVNRYPGCACDVPSHLYSFSFEPRPNWSRRFAPRAEIQRYLEHCVERYDLADQLRLNCEVKRLVWDERSQCWDLHTKNGQQFQAQFVVSAIGGLSRPAWPDLPGLEQFKGPIMHSQLWDDRVELENKRIAVIGTGASAVQFVPEITPRVQALQVYQRTPNWILPRPDRSIPLQLQRAYRRFPWLQRWVRFGIWLKAECRVPGLVWTNRLAFGHRWLARRHLRRQIADPALRAKLTPTYAIGCKRVLLSSTYYPALAQGHVELVDRAIERIESDAIVDADGQRRPVDGLILATGFNATQPIPEGMVIGRNHQDLHRVWQDGPQAYRGTTVAGFPNLFMLLGPNTALGHNSVIQMIEAQIRFIHALINQMQAQQLAVVEVRVESQRRFNQHLHDQLATSVWNEGGCGSWYLHRDSGLNTTLWPSFTWRYRRLMHRIVRSDFKFEPTIDASNQ